MSGVAFAVMRHAPTTWNAEGHLQGTTDISLGQTGEAAAKAWRLPAPAGGWRPDRRADTALDAGRRRLAIARDELRCLGRQERCAIAGGRRRELRCRRTAR